MPPEIIFHHLQKTGGTSIRPLINKIFGKAVVPKASRGDIWEPPHPEILAAMRNARALMGHMPFGVHRLLPVEVPYFTIVRDPASRLVSKFRSNKCFENKGLKPADVWVKDWGMVYQLSGASRRELRELNEGHVKIAMQNLKRHYLYIGDTSRMEELGDWMRGMGWPVPKPLPWENKARAEIAVTDRDWEEVRRKVKEEVGSTLDQKLYDWVCELGPRPPDWPDI